MDWRVLLTTFGVIFLAEMDKTQLAAMTMAAQTKKPWAVFIGASIALVCVSAIGVVVGGVLGNYVPRRYGSSASPLSRLSQSAYLSSPGSFDCPSAARNEATDP